MSPPSHIPNSHNASVAAASSNRAPPPRGTSQHQSHHTRTSIQAQRNPDIELRGIGSKFDCTNPPSHARYLQARHPSHLVYTVVPQMHFTESSSPSSNPTRPSYLHTTQAMESDLRSISALSSSRSHTQNSATGRPFYEVNRPRADHINTRPLQHAPLSHAPARAYHTPVSTPGYSQMARWHGETARQQPWNDIGEVSVVSSHGRLSDQRWSSDYHGSSRRNGGSSDF